MIPPVFRPADASWTKLLGSSFAWNSSFYTFNAPKHSQTDVSIHRKASFMRFPVVSLNQGRIGNLRIAGNQVFDAKGQRRLFTRIVEFTMIIAAFFIPVSMALGQYTYLMVLLGTLALFSISYYLNCMEREVLSKVLYMLTFFSAITVLAFVVGISSGIHFGYLPVSMLSLLLFRNKWISVLPFLACLGMAIGFHAGYFGEVTNTLEHDEAFIHMNLVIIGLVLFGFFFNVYFSSSAEFKDQKLIFLNRESTKRNEEIMKNLEMARKIQSSLFPPDFAFNSLFPDSFVVYLPRETVSGDFYWVDQVGDTKYCAMIDCTGHGVPAAFVSILGHQGLNRCLYDLKITEPADILNRLHEIMFHVLRKDVNLLLDGMDMSLFALNTKDNTLTFSGAQNSLLLVRDNQLKYPGHDPEYRGIYESLYKIPGQRQSVGSEYLKRPFTQQTFTIQEEDVLYLYTDGYVDQFGGNRGKKMMHKPFKKLLLSIQNLDMKGQQKELIRYYNNWKEDLPQIDDVCVIGIRLK